MLLKETLHKNQQDNNYAICKLFVPKNVCIKTSEENNTNTDSTEATFITLLFTGTQKKNVATLSHYKKDCHLGKQSSLAIMSLGMVQVTCRVIILPTLGGTLPCTSLGQPVLCCPANFNVKWTTYGLLLPFTLVTKKILHIRKIKQCTNTI